MIRKLLLPLAALVLLAGCVSTGYSYRSGSGDYYHGRARVEYRHYPAHPYGYYDPYRYRYSSPYGYRYYGYPYGYRHRYIYPYYPRHQVRPRTDSTPDRPRSPWRDFDRLRDREVRDDGVRDRDVRDRGLRDTGDRDAASIRPSAPRPALPPPRTRSGSGDSSAIGGMLRRTRERGHKNTSP